MTAYYNEFDPYAAQWLRNLIAAGHIAPGVVDERSITEVHPDELRGYTQCHFFAGIGVWSHALRSAGWDDSRPVWTGSCPCQPFSSAGKRLGIADERHLWPAFAKLIAECKPATVFGEQVASGAGRDWLASVRADLEGMGYAVGAADLCAAGTGAPHIRQRLYWVADAAGQQEHQKQQGSATHEGRRSADGVGRCSVAGGLADAKGSRRGVWDSDDQRKADGEIDAPSNDCQDRGLADTDNARQQGDGLQPLQRGRAGDGEVASIAGLGAVGGVADTKGGRHGQYQRNSGAMDCPRSSYESQKPQLGRATQAAGHCGETHGLADTTSSGLTGTGGSGSAQELGAAERSVSCGLGNTDCTGQSARDAESKRATARPAKSTDTGAQSRPRTPDGFWSAPDWLWCRDGKWRPVESGTEPLATGAAARVGRLRAYGNALCAPVAEAFVQAYLTE